VPVDRAQAAQAPLSHAARARRGGAAARLRTFMRAQPFITPMHAAGSRHAPAATHSRTALKDRAAATLSCGITPSTIMSPSRSHPGPRTDMAVRPRARTVQ
jgi:hypothetical protein